MIAHTLRDNQSKVLADKLEALLPGVVEEEKHQVAKNLLWKLKKCNPRPDQIWAYLHLTEDESQLFSILCRLALRKKEPKPVEGNG